MDLYRASGETSATKPLAGRVFIITGAGRGLGREMALAMGRAGASIACAARNGGELDEVVAELRAESVSAIAVPTDVTSWEAVQNLVAVTRREMGAIDGLVANAGGSVGMSPTVEDTPLEDWEATIRLNLTSTFYCAKAVIPHLRERGRGTIITVSSGNGFRGESRLLAYSSSKAGVVALTMGLATALAPDGITVNCIVPGVMVTAAAAKAGRADQVKSRGKFIPVGRVGEDSEIGALAVLLASDEARFITGEAIPIDGGGLAGGIAPVGWQAARGTEAQG